jgi:stress response protein YsnF
MAHTVIGFFRNSTDAYNSVDVLKSKGFNDSNIDVSATYGSYENADEGRDWTDKVGNFFRSMFGDNDKANKYSQVARNNPMVTVHTFSEDEAVNAADILDDCGAFDVDEREPEYSDRNTGWASDELSGSQRDTRNNLVTDDVSETEYSTSDSSMNTDDYSRRDKVATNQDVTDTDFQQNETNFSQKDVSDYSRTEAGLSADSNIDRDREESFPIIEEQVNVGKREVPRGGVRVKSRIIERPVEETLRLREERVRVERNQVNREATEADLANFREGTMEVREYGEEPVISKTARVVEEVRIERDIEERNETVHDTERKTEVEVEEYAKSSYDKP